MDGYFEDSEEIRAPPNTSTSPTTHSNVQCICFNCWGPVTSGSSSSKTWKSLEQCGIPILPVFVGSPTDSLLMYGGAEGKPDSLSLRMNTNHTDVSMDSTLPSQSSSGASNASSGWRNVASFLESSTNKSTNDVNTQKVELEEENDLLQMKIQLQSEVIQKLIELSNVSEKLTKMKSR
uniref:Late endosomal/lysosomal adaptor and MAPK and MTOR activator 1 n=1 Tax=Caenorhabditis tropicalis TaxID=1561998 RepID=A0A1I7TFP7_9PELO